MKLQISILSLLACVSLTAAAQVTVDRMTCTQAQHFAKKYNRYYKDGGPDGAIPIYPVQQLQDLRCGKAFPRPQTERTLDNPECIIGWYCNAY